MFWQMTKKVWKKFDLEKLGSNGGSGEWGVSGAAEAAGVAYKEEEEQEEEEVAGAAAAAAAAAARSKTYHKIVQINYNCKLAKIKRHLFHLA